MTQKKSKKQKKETEGKEKQEFPAMVEVGQMRADYMETFHEPEEVNIVPYPGIPLQVRIGEIPEKEEYLQPIDELEAMHEITV